ncbi:uncharacterized protein PAE49_014808 [Odontesthes bonariensis]|uniref:uncharacterized protein LOC142397278 n=1 Tax=Odontesthes bonariensis TaxID=219752 RepID=UPI003F583B30
MIILNSRHIALCCSLIFCLLTVFVSADQLIATVGTDVTLRCSYDAPYYGRLSVCWGRGAIPNSGCANEVMKTDGTSVISRLSERYLLLGNLGNGDVSLTIRQAQESDSGTYGCRVDIPGWFNDQKQEMTLTVKAGRPFPLKVETKEVTDRTVTVGWTPAFDGGRPVTDYIILLKNKQESWDSAIRTEMSKPQLTQVTLVDLRPAMIYNIQMFSVNSVGNSEGSNVLTLTTKEAAPDGPPLDMTLEALSSRSIRVTWKPPKADLRNGVIRSYAINYKGSESMGVRIQEGFRTIIVTATRELESIILNNLKPSTKYGVIIQAKTNAGIGPSSAAPLCSTLDEVQETTVPTSTAVTMWIQHTSFTSGEHTSFPSVLSTATAETTSASTVGEKTSTGITSVPPDPPVVELKEVKDNTISLSWTPGFEGDSPITSYILEYKAAGAPWDRTKNIVDYSPNQTDATIIEINPSTYNIRMFAKNNLGISKASNVLTITTGKAGHHRKDFIATISTDTQHAVSINLGLVLINSLDITYCNVCRSVHFINSCSPHTFSGHWF